MALAGEILKVASLARLELKEGERERFSKEFEVIVAYFAELQKLTLEGEMTLDYPCPRFEDEPGDYDIDVGKLSNDLKEGYFKIPPLLA